MDALVIVATTLAIILAWFGLLFGVVWVADAWMNKSTPQVTSAETPQWTLEGFLDEEIKTLDRAIEDDAVKQGLNTQATT